MAPSVIENVPGPTSVSGFKSKISSSDREGVAEVEKSRANFQYGGYPGYNATGTKIGSSTSNKPMRKTFSISRSTVD